MKLKDFFIIEIVNELYDIVKFVLRSVHSTKVVATIFICFLMYLSVKEHYAAEVVVPSGLASISWLFAIRKTEKAEAVSKAIEADKSL